MQKRRAALLLFTALFLTVPACDSSKDDPATDTRPGDALDAAIPDVRPSDPALPADAVDLPVADGGPDAPPAQDAAGPDAAATADVVPDLVADGLTQDSLPASDAPIIGSAGPAVGPCPALVPAATIEGTIETDQIWRGPLAVKGNVRVLGVTITIEPGTALVMDADASIEFGADGTDGRILALGTAAAGVRFCGKEATPGHWEGVALGAQLNEATLRYVTISDGGKTTPPLHVETLTTVDHVTVDHNLTGIRIEGVGFTAQSSTLSVTNTTMEWGVYVDPDAAITMPKGGVYLTGNMYPSILIVGDTYRATGTLPNLDADFRVSMPLSITDGASLTIEPGSVLIMENRSSLNVGTLGEEGTLILAGTGAQPIRFMSHSLNVTGIWDGIVIGPQATDDSRLAYVQIEGAGQATGAALTAQRPVKVTNSSFKASQGYCIRRDPSDTTDYLTGNSFEGCTLGSLGP